MRPIQLTYSKLLPSGELETIYEVFRSVNQLITKYDISGPSVFKILQGQIVRTGAFPVGYKLQYIDLKSEPSVIESLQSTSTTDSNSKSQSMKCSICNCTFKKESMANHIRSQKHKKALIYSKGYTQQTSVNPLTCPAANAPNHSIAPVGEICSVPA